MSSLASPDTIVLTRATVSGTKVETFTTMEALARYAVWWSVPFNDDHDRLLHEWLKGQLFELEAYIAKRTAEALVPTPSGRVYGDD